ncbi:MAG: Fe-S-cluster-containing dehydrogenase component [Myxococcota bacterium]|jgi:Fe-S-cluster-containing dehydrogenase component
MNYGFVIDNGSCIGCHACSTACKSENSVPLGVHRTWVKYVESGQFPDSRRNFQVTRCNHCANPPCVRICPTQAMYQRDDGIVEFDSDACIGCKACTQACPYDAIYIDPETRTAAKCHYCSHRTDVGLEPACVVVCPEHAIIAGDLDDPESEISRVVAKNNTTVRKPEQGTSPKLFYIEGNELALSPTAAMKPESYLWADVQDDGHHSGYTRDRDVQPRTTRANDRGTTVRVAELQGNPSHGPITVGSTMAEHMVQVAFNAQHHVQWHWPIPLYIITKHIAGGSFLFLALAALLPALPFAPVAMVYGGALAIAMTLVTLGLLLYDLDRPDRFFYLLIRPQWKSWVARAAWILSGFSGVTGAWWAVETAAWLGLIDPGTAAAVRVPFAVAAIPFSVMASLYTAFLFAQAEGRDLWQSAHVPAQMAAQGVMFGAAPFAAMALLVDLPSAFTSFAWLTFLLATVASLGITLVADLAFPHASEVARRAQADMVGGRFRMHWMAGIVLGHGLTLALLLAGHPVASALAFLSAAAGLFAYAYAFVMAPQMVPNS